MSRIYLYSSYFDQQPIVNESNHRHVKKDRLINAASAARLVGIISTVSGCCKKGKMLWQCGASSGHTTKLKQPIFFRYL
jgi:hypothetical protein